MKLLRDSRWQKSYLIGGTLLLALSHRLVNTPDKQVHNLLYNLNFIPIIAAAMLFGWRMGIVITVLTMAAEYPYLQLAWPHDSTYRMDQIGETFASGIAGLVVGWLADRERRQRQEIAEVNEDLRTHIEALKKAERMYAVAQLSASLAHEIRNPLASISGAAGILKRGNASPNNVEECLDVIEKESNRLNKLLSNFLTFARPRAPRFQPTDLVAVIDSTIALASHSGEAMNVKFRRRIDGELPEVSCDSEQLKQVLLNLVMNAVHATAAGVVDLRAYCEQGQAFITVHDEGEGIPKDQESRVFEPFFTTKTNGSGLGLAIASKIVEQHGGRLTAQNSPGKGLTMIVQLPVTQETA